MMTDINQVLQQLDWSREPKGLYEPIGYALSAGGKRLRPTLALMACRLFGGNEQEVLPAALALEVFHNFTLLHDDVMDKAQVRRGRPCVHVKWNENTAILSGDQMLIEAYRLISQVPATFLPKVLNLFTQMATEICEGQQLDVDYEKIDDSACSMDDYLNMIRLKTGVLLATALQIGAYMAGADDRQQEAIYQYGIELGLAFQIQDDYLDCFGDEKTFGKAIGGDIREGKKTWLRLTATHHPDVHVQQIQSQDIATVLAEYRRLSVDQAALGEIKRRTERAMMYLDRLPQNTITDDLRHLAAKMAERRF